MTLLRLDDYFILLLSNATFKDIEYFLFWESWVTTSTTTITGLTKDCHTAPTCTCVYFGLSYYCTNEVYIRIWEKLGSGWKVDPRKVDSQNIESSPTLCLNGATYINITHTARVRDTGALCGSIQEYWHGDHVLKRLNANKSEQWREITYIKN